MPAKFTDSLRGYGYEVMKRDGFRCVYCQLDGHTSFNAWLQLSVDHLLPKGDPRREQPEYIVCSCNFCNCSDNRYFDLASGRGISFENLTREQLVKQRKRFVDATRAAYEEFWSANVAGR